MDNLKLVQPKEKSVAHTLPSLRHIILLVVCNMVKYVLKPVLLFGVKYTDGSDSDSLWGNPAMLAISFRHTAVTVRMNTMQVFVYRHSLLLARKRGGITVLDIMFFFSLILKIRMVIPVHLVMWRRLLRSVYPPSPKDALTSPSCHNKQDANPWPSPVCSVSN